MAALSIALMTVLLMVGTVASGAAELPREALVYFGTYTQGKSQGIYVSRMNLQSGVLSQPELAVEAGNPSFLAIHPDKQFLYAVGGTDRDGVLAFRIRENGSLEFINERSSGGAGPTHLTVDRSGKNVIVANYNSGSVACLPLNSDGSLEDVVSFMQHEGASVNPRRQTSPHAHGVYADPESTQVFVPDLGLDKVMIYNLDANRGKLTPGELAYASVAPGSGPRHMAFGTDGRFVYVINELLCTMTVFQYDRQEGRLTEVQTLSTLPEGVRVESGYSTAEVFLHPNGKFLYGSNRGHGTLAVFAVNNQDGTLRLTGNVPTLARTPRGFGIDPTGRFLIVGGQRSDTATVFRIDADTGALEPTGQSVEVGSPVCVEFLIR